MVPFMHFVPMTLLNRPGMLFGLPLVSIWYWCIDQEMVQRVLSARSLRQAQTGTAAAGLLKILPPFITGFVFSNIRA